VPRVSLPPYEKPSESSDPRDTPLDRPSSLVSAKLPAILRLRTCPIPPMRGDELDPPTSEPLAMAVTVVGLVTDHSLRLRSRTPRPSATDFDRRERGFEKRDFARGR